MCETKSALVGSLAEIFKEKINAEVGEYYDDIQKALTILIEYVRNLTWSLSGIQSSMENPRQSYITFFMDTEIFDAIVEARLIKEGDLARSAFAPEKSKFLACLMQFARYQGIQMYRSDDDMFGRIRVSVPFDVRTM